MILSQCTEARDLAEPLCMAAITTTVSTNAIELQWHVGPAETSE
jgi:hypothetical protein